VNGTRGLIIATAAAFIVGCSVGLMGGIVFVHLVASRRHGPVVFEGVRGGGRPPFFGRGWPGPGPGGRDGMLPALDRALDLSPEQHERLITVLDRARHEHEVVRDSMHVWIERELTPAQRERWRQMEDRYVRSRRVRWIHDPHRPDRR
jgi:hypothetical protein